MMSTNTMQENSITIPMAGLEVAQGNVTLKTFVGSCLAACIYDESKKIGGMAHIMLPRNNTGKTTIGTIHEGKFADDAVEVILKKMNAISPVLRLKAKIAGGAKIFSHETDDGILNIGNKNILGLHEILKEKKIPVVAESVGANYGRWVTFSCDNQRAIVKEKDGEKIL